MLPNVNRYTQTTDDGNLRKIYEKIKVQNKNALRGDKLPDIQLNSNNICYLQWLKQSINFASKFDDSTWIGVMRFLLQKVE
jgi:hypothetical protein